MHTVTLYIADFLFFRTASIEKDKRT